MAAVETTLRGPVPATRFLATRFADVPREVLFGTGRTATPHAHDGHGHHHHAHDHDHHDHGEAFRAWSWTSATPLDRAAFRNAVRRLPATLLRMKGVLAFADRPGERAVFQLVGRRHTTEVVTGPAPAECALVAIARTGELDADALTALLDGCRAGG